MITATKVVADEFLMSAGADFKVLATEEDYINVYEYDKDYLVCQYLKKNKYGTMNFTLRKEFN